MKDTFSQVSGDNVGAPIRVIVVMGPSGCGKTTVGSELARRASARFIDADHHHPITNVEKMRAGLALSDEDRVPWLQGLAELIHDDEGHVVLACSALKDQYRQILRQSRDDVLFSCLLVPKEELAHRLKMRAGHFFHPQLLDSQIATLQIPRGDEIDGSRPVSEIVTELAARASWKLS